MILDELNSLIRTATWFSNLGEPDVPREFIRIPSLAGDDISHQMDWLPTSRGQDDPIHGHSLEQRAEVTGKKQEFWQQSLEVYQTTLVMLRKFEGNPILKVGPNDFTEAARGAALFAARRAALEVLLGERGLWYRIMNVYHAGHWPCGILPNNRIVVL